MHYRKPHHVQVPSGGAQTQLDDFQDATKLSSLLGEVSSAARTACELLPAPEHLLASVDHVKPGSLGRAADDPAILEAAAVALAGWCDTVEALLAEPETRKCVQTVVAQGHTGPCCEAVLPCPKRLRVPMPGSSKPCRFPVLHQLFVQAFFCRVRW